MNIYWWLQCSGICRRTPRLAAFQPRSIFCGVVWGDCVPEESGETGEHTGKVLCLARVSLRFAQDFSP